MEKYTPPTKPIRVNIDLLDRLRKMRGEYESWSAFFDRMIPEEKA